MISGLAKDIMSDVRFRVANNGLARMSPMKNVPNSDVRFDKWISQQ